MQEASAAVETTASTARPGTVVDTTIDTTARRSDFLQVKLASLASEARIIRAKEQRLLKRMRRAKGRAALADTPPGPGYLSNEATLFGIRNHRITEVRSEARHSHLAHGFLRGRDYAQMEQFTYTSPKWGKVEETAKRFCQGDWRVEGQRFANWADNAKAHCKPLSVEENYRQRQAEKQSVGW